jgi:hypothetical protein
MKHLIFLFLLCVYTLQANSNFIQTLQNNFFLQVNEPHIFKRYYHQFISKNCFHENISCIASTIKRLQSWQSVQNNHAFEKAYNKYLQEIQVSKEQKKRMKIYLHNIIKQKNITHSQFLTLIELQTQRLNIFFYDTNTQNLSLIGSDLISSGNMDKEKEITLGQDHYLKTPTGVFESLQGWRTNGKQNTDGITKPYGHKGRFVFYFGQQHSIRYNTFDKHKQKITNENDYTLIKDTLELALHAHESALSLGKPHSHGCVRVSNELNIFLDERLILHANNIHNKQWINKTAQAPKNFKKQPYFGKYLIIVDSI